MLQNHNHQPLNGHPLRGFVCSRENGHSEKEALFQTEWVEGSAGYRLSNALSRSVIPGGEAGVERVTSIGSNRARPGIQTVLGMPSERVDTDCVCSDLAWRQRHASAGWHPVLFLDPGSSPG